MAKPIQLVAVTPDDRGRPRFKLLEAGVAALERFPTPVSFVTVTGLTGVGASRTASLLMAVGRAADAEAVESIFRSSSADGQVTKGIWLWGKPLPRADGATGSVALLDAQGWGRSNVDPRISDSIALLSMLISSSLVVLYGQRSPDKTTLRVLCGGAGMVKASCGDTWTQLMPLLVLVRTKYDPDDSTAALADSDDDDAPSATSCGATLVSAPTASAALEKRTVGSTDPGATAVSLIMRYIPSCCASSHMEAFHVQAVNMVRLPKQLDEGTGTSAASAGRVMMAYAALGDADEFSCCIQQLHAMSFGTAAKIVQHRDSSAVKFLQSVVECVDSKLVAFPELNDADAHAAASKTAISNATAEAEAAFWSDIQSLRDKIVTQAQDARHADAVSAAEQAKLLASVCGALRHHSNAAVTYVQTRTAALLAERAAASSVVHSPASMPWMRQLLPLVHAPMQLSSPAALAPESIYADEANRAAAAVKAAAVRLSESLHTQAEPWMFEHVLRACSNADASDRAIAAANLEAVQAQGRAAGIEAELQRVRSQLDVLQAKETVARAHVMAHHSGVGRAGTQAHGHGGGSLSQAAPADTAKHHAATATTMLPHARAADADSRHERGETLTLSADTGVASQPAPPSAAGSRPAGADTAATSRHLTSRCVGEGAAWSPLQIYFRAPCAHCGFLPPRSHVPHAGCCAAMVEPRVTSSLSSFWHGGRRLGAASAVIPPSRGIAWAYDARRGPDWQLACQDCQQYVTWALDGSTNEPICGCIVCPSARCRGRIMGTVHCYGVAT